MKRSSTQLRKTRETEIEVKLNIDGKGKSDINTGLGFLNHMLELFAFFAIFDLEIKAKGDLEVDIHHTNEDIGITLGKALKEALGNARGIKRFGEATVSMEECLVRVNIDICGRSRFDYAEKQLLPLSSPDLKYSYEEGEHFLESFIKQCGINLNLGIIKGSQDTHHVLEAIFKGLGLALKMACSIEPRRQGITSTKGIIDL